MSSCSMKNNGKAYYVTWSLGLGNPVGLVKKAPIPVAAHLRSKVSDIQILAQKNKKIYKKIQQAVQILIKMEWLETKRLGIVNTTATIDSFSSFYEFYQIAFILAPSHEPLQSLFILYTILVFRLGQVKKVTHEIL